MKHPCAEGALCACSDVCVPPALIALAGQPNVGKSTLFNRLTGLRQHVGNWPGKTIERKTGAFIACGRNCQIVDLPGTYSLTAHSAEEVITRQFILQEHPDVVVAMVNAALLERGLYLVAELLALEAPVIVVLNMLDVAQQEGLTIEPEVLAAALGVPVAPLVATHGQGLSNLLQIIEQMSHGQRADHPKLPQIQADHQDAFNALRRLITRWTPPGYPESWVALKLLEADQEITALMQARLPAGRWQAVQELLAGHEDAPVAVASGRYEWIGRMLRAAMTHPVPGQIGVTERLDQWATHPWWGLGLLAGIFGLVFWLTYTVGAPLQKILELWLVAPLETAAKANLAPTWLARLTGEGVVAGAGTVLSFVPILAIFFAVLGVLEDVGYMARAAYVMDRFMHPLGLHGKSFLPLCLGFGCNVPAVLGCRIIESGWARRLTIFLAPLVPCTARMAVVAVLVPALFGASAALVSFGLMLIGLTIMAVTGIVLHRTFLRGEYTPFIMELPLYHYPNWRVIGLGVWQRTLAFVKKAGTVIVVASIVIWGLAAWPDGQPEHSFLAMVGRGLEPIGQLMGLDWRLLVALLAGLAAKENAIAALAVVCSAQEGGLAAMLATHYSKASLLAFLVIQMLFIPCVATLAAIRQETQSWSWTLGSVAFLLAVSITTGSTVYWLAYWAGF